MESNDLSSKSIFVHIPKNAGQSIEHVLAPLLLTYNNNPELGPPRLAHLKAREYVSCKYLTREQFDDYFKFAFVRDPGTEWSQPINTSGRTDMSGSRHLR
jgi:hypothetical protein